MATVATVEAELGIKVSQFMRDVNNASVSMEKAGREMARSADHASTAIDKLTKFAGTALKAAVGIGLGTAILRGAANLRNLGKEAVMGAARIDQMNLVLNKLGTQVGYTSDEVEKMTAAIVANGIETSVAQRTVQNFLQYNLDLAQASNLARVAQDAAVMSNSNSSETLDRLIYGISTQNSMLLRNAGVQVMAGQAIEKYAQSNHIAASAMTSSQRTQAVLNGVLAEGAKMNGAYEESMKNPLKVLGSMKRVQTQVANNLGKTMFPAFQVMVLKGLMPFWKWLAKSTEEGTRLRAMLDGFGQTLADDLAVFIEFLKGDGGQAMAELAKSTKEVFSSFSVLGKVLADTNVLTTLLQGAAEAMKVLAAVVKPLAPLLRGMMALHMWNRFGKSINLSSLSMKRFAVATSKVRLQMGEVALAGPTMSGALLTSTTTASAGMVGLRVAINSVKAAMASMLPLLAAMVAVEVVTKLFAAFSDKGHDAASAQSDLNDALAVGIHTMEDYEAALASYLSTSNSSVFVEENQVNDIKRIAETLGTSTKYVEDYIIAVADGSKSQQQWIDLLVKAEEISYVKTGDRVQSDKAFGGAVTLPGWVPKWAKQGVAISDHYEGNTGIMSSPEKLGVDIAGGVNAQLQDLAAKAPEVRALLAEMFDVKPLVDFGANPSITGSMMSEADAVAKFNEAISASELPLADQQAALLAVIEVMDAKAATDAEAAALADQARRDYEENQIRIEALGLGSIEAGTKFAEFEKSVAGVNVSFKGLQERLGIAGKSLRTIIDNTNQAAKTNKHYKDVMGEVTAGTKTYQQALSQLVNEMPALVDRAAQLAESWAIAAHVSITGEEAAAKFSAELENQIAVMVANGKAANFDTSQLEALARMLADLDGRRSEMFLRLSLETNMDIDLIKAKLAAVLDLSTRAAGLDPELRAMVEVLRGMLLIAEAADAAVADIGSSSSGGGGGSSAEPTFGGLTQAEWEAIAGLIEEIEGHYAQVVQDFSAGSGAITGLVSAQDRYHQLIEATTTLTERRNTLQQEGIPDLERRVALLQAEADAITGTEQLGIEKAQHELAAAKRRERAGIVTAAAVQAAEEKLAAAKDAATAPTGELESAEAALATAKQEVLDIDKQLHQNALDQISAQAQLAAAFENVAGNVDLVAEAIGNIDWSNIMGASDIQAEFDAAIANAIAVQEAYTPVVPNGSLVADWVAAGMTPDQIIAGLLASQGGGSGSIFGASATPPITPSSGHQFELFSDGGALAMGGGKRMTNNITINAGIGADGEAIGHTIVELLQAYESDSGPLPISVSGSYVSGGGVVQ